MRVITALWKTACFFLRRYLTTCYQLLRSIWRSWSCVRDSFSGIRTNLQFVIIIRWGSNSFISWDKWWKDGLANRPEHKTGRLQFVSPTYIRGTQVFTKFVGAGISQSVQWLAMGSTARGSNPGGDEIFRNRRDRALGLHSLLYKYNGYHVPFQGVKRPGRGVEHAAPSSAEVKVRVEL